MSLKCFFVIFLLLRITNTEEIYEKVEVIMGQTAELPCNVSTGTEDMKLNIVVWYRVGSSAALYSRDLREEGSSASAASGRYRLVTSDSEGVNMLQILKTLPSDAGRYQCLADFDSHPGQWTYVEVAVIEPPRYLYVVHENGSGIVNTSAGANASHNIGPYFTGDTVHLFCVALGGKPRPEVSWWTDDRQLKQTSTPLSDLRVRSELAVGPLTREDHGRVLSCVALNNDRTPALSIDITLDMYLPPELVSVRASRSSTESIVRVHAEDPVSLQCRVLGARPPPPVHWRMDNSELLNIEQNITSEPSQRRVVSELELSVTAEHDEAMVTCCVPDYRRDSAEFICARELPLSVTYAPIVEIAVDGELQNNTLAVLKGDNVTLNCTYQANPTAYLLMWFHEDNVINRDGNDEGMQPVLELRDVSEKDAGEYVCSATNEEGSQYSESITIDVIYAPFCEDDSVTEYGLAESDSINITCNVKGNPTPTSYSWVVVNEAVHGNVPSTKYPDTITEEPYLTYQRPNDTEFNTIFCWGNNDVVSDELTRGSCRILITDETAPRPPTDCEAAKNTAGDITVNCKKGHDGGLPQKFTLTVKTESDEEIMSITSLEPKFIFQEPKQDNYKFNIISSNQKGDSGTVVIDKENIIDETTDRPPVVNAVSDITTLALALGGGVALVALAACGLVLCARDRADGPRTRAASEPPLCAYNTEESNCETYHDSDDSDCNVRRTDSFRRAVAKYPSQNFDVRRTSSFHSARYIQDLADHEGVSKCNDTLRHSASCRRSLQNISRKRDMDIFCDHLVTHLPPEVNYPTPRPMNTFCTMPRKIRQKRGRDISDETSEITQMSDGYSLPPPPDEFTSYRAGVRIRDIPQKSTPTYTTIVRKNSTGKDPVKYSNIQSPINNIGLTTVSGAHSLYTYPDDDQGQQTNTNPFDNSP